MKMRRFFCYVAALMLLLAGLSASADLHLRGNFEDASLAVPTRATLRFAALLQLQAKERDEKVLIPARKALQYLIDNMPASDLGVVTAETLARITLQRIKKRLAKWPRVPWDIFLEFTVPYAALTEPRDQSLSAEFMDKLEEYMNSFCFPQASLHDMACVLNVQAYKFTDPPIVFKAAPPNKVNAYSPWEVVRDKAASCTGESVFLVHALRLAGIPARVAGVPHWNRGMEICPEGDASPACGNHNWVEVYTESGWVFLDQNTDNPPNNAWFFPERTDELEPGSKYHAVYAATWNMKSRTCFPLVFDPDNHDVPAIDRTSWYQGNKDDLLSKPKIKDESVVDDVQAVVA